LVSPIKGWFSEWAGFFFVIIIIFICL
jgi:hypothetical protein